MKTPLDFLKQQTKNKAIPLRALQKTYKHAVKTKQVKKVSK